MKQKYFILWCFSLIVTSISASRPPVGNIDAQIINKGNLKIKSSTVVNFGGAHLNTGTTDSYKNYVFKGLPNDGDITFNNSQRVFVKETAANSIFHKASGAKSKAASEMEPKRFIRIGYEGPDMFHRQIVLGFLPNCRASLDFDLGYDALMFDPRDDEIFYIIENDLTRKYVIEGVGAYNPSYEFPIGIKIAQDGTHTIMIDAVENFEDVIYIKDNVLNTYYSLTESNFSLNLPPGEYLDRFSIVFSDVTSKSTLDTKDVFADNNLRVYYLNNKVVINNKNNLELSDASIFNTVGQKITNVNRNDLKQSKITIPFMYQQQGMYIVNVASGQRNKTFKIIN